MGNSVRFWIDTWAVEKPFKELFPDLYSLETCKSILVSDCFYVHDSLVSWNWRWKRPFVSIEEQRQYNECISSLSEFRLSSDEDRWLWTKNETKGFLVRSMKTMLQNLVNDDQQFTFKWNSWISIKTNIFGWRAVKEMIPTRKALATRGVHLQSTYCPICHIYEEDMNHLLTGCEVSHHVWSKVASWCNLQPIFAFDVEDLLKIHETSQSSRSLKKVINAIVLTSIWSLWKSRNELIFESKRVSLVKVFQDIQSLSYL